MAEAWKLAQERISKAQTHQKKQHDKLVKNSKFSEGDVVFLYDPSLKTGKVYIQICKTIPWFLQDSTFSKRWSRDTVGCKAQIQTNSCGLQSNSTLSKRDK